MNIKLLTEQHLESLSLNGICPGLSETTLSKCHSVRNHMSRLIWHIVISFNLFSNYCTLVCALVATMQKKSGVLATRPECFNLQ